MAHATSWQKLLQREIANGIIRRFVDNYDLSFITSQKLKEVWDGYPRQFQQMQDVTDITFDHNDFQFSEYIKILSILVMIDFDQWDKVGVLIREGFRDESLPFELMALNNVWLAKLFVDDEDQSAVTAFYARKFHQEQYIFCPVSVKESRDLVFEHRGMRFPILMETSLGSGSSGSVTEVVIAKGYLVSRFNNSRSTTEKKFAKKKFYSVRDGLVEQEILKRLRNNSQLEGQKNIMSSFASVVIGPLVDGRSECHLFFECAPADLGKFLRQKPGDQGVWYQKDDVTPRALFTEIRDLTSALEFLHGANLRVSHSDLKPDNILVVFHKSHPLGRWMITDFGIASVEEKDRSEVKVVGDTARQSYMASRVMTNEVFRYDQRGPGPYQPPEVLNPEYVQHEPGYLLAGDIWSLGCIAVCVMVYAIGGKGLHKELQLLLRTGRDQTRIGYFYCDATPVSGLLPEFVEFMEKQTEKWDECGQMTTPRKVWAKSFWEEIILPMLQIPVTHRIGAEKLLPKLKLFVRDKMPNSNIWDDYARSYNNVSLPSRSTSSASSSQVTNFQPVPRATTKYLRDSSAVTAEGPGRRRAEQRVPAVSPVQEEVFIPSPTNSVPVDANSRTSSIHSPGTTSSESNTNQKSREGFSAVRIAEDGQRILFLGTSGVKCASRNPASTSWKNHPFTVQSVPGPVLWDTIRLAGSFYLLRNIQDVQMQLHNLDDAFNVYQNVRNDKFRGQLSSASMVDVSSRGHIALVYDQGKSLSIYDRRGEHVFTSNLSVDATDTAQSGKKRRDTSVSALAFDPTGEYLVVIDWEKWYVWVLNDTVSKKPNKNGEHSCLSSRSKPLLQVFSGAEHFMLYDECSLYICKTARMATSQATCELSPKPKPGTLTLSKDGNWLVYLVGPKRGGLFGSKDTLYYSPISNGSQDTNSTPRLGSFKKHELSTIKTSGLQNADQIALRVVVSERGPEVVVATTLGHLELVELRP